MEYYNNYYCLMRDENIYNNVSGKLKSSPEWNMKSYFVSLNKKLQK